ncbi:uncharacterized protein LOC121428646 isoform X3 [Lytechinus variegatus]|uniref:uncharacterized protein LOC121428646 isoform X3 n=1 Tax=Lytechinus variegatus TaxID=7654 RepID=UPI001BB229AC|nr:uncharacterized protein LOC121428646 isoform X3 [Lytechinus variegatus]
MAAQVHLGLPKFDVKLGPNFGYVFTKEAVEEMIRHHEVSTFSSFTIQQTRCTAAAKEGPGTGDKGGPRIYWQDVATSKFSVPAAAIPFDGIPYTYVSRLLYECHHGKDWKEKQKLLKQDQRKQVGEHGYVGTKSRRLIQPTKKLNCPAKLIVKEVFKYPDFKISQDTKHNRVVNSSKLRSALANVPVSSERRYYIYLPNNDDHKGTHVIGEAMEQNHWKKEVKERKKKKREERLIRLAEQQIREKKDFSSNGKEEKEEDNQGRPWTLSIALPGSILDNAQSPELRTYLAGQGIALLTGSTDQTFLWLCTSAGAITFLALLASVGNLALIAVNRLLKITRSQTIYDRVYTQRNIVLMIIISWVLPFLILVILWSLGFINFGYGRFHKACFINAQPRGKSLFLSLASTYIVIVFVTISVIYVKISLFIRKRNRQVAPAAAAGRDIMVTKTLSSVVAVYFMCMGSIAVFYLIKRIVFPGEELYMIYLLQLPLSNSIMNPFIYAFKHNVFRHTFQCILKCRLSDIQEPSRQLQVLLGRRLCGD